MGLFRFDNLPVNTLIGADRETFDAVVKGREIGDKYKPKFRNTVCIRWILGCIGRYSCCWSKRGK